MKSCSIFVEHFYRKKKGLLHKSYYMQLNTIQRKIKLVQFL